MVSIQEGFPGVKEHTVLHEVREILEHIFKDLGYPTGTTGEELEARAEHFAFEVRFLVNLPLFKSMQESTKGVESKLLRWGAYGLILLFALGHLASCALLPYFERSHAQAQS